MTQQGDFIYIDFIGAGEKDSLTEIMITLDDECSYCGRVTVTADLRDETDDVYGVDICADCLSKMAAEINSYKERGGNEPL